MDFFCNKKINNIKDYISENTKNQVWDRDCHPFDSRVAPCASCGCLVYKPQSISKIDPTRLPYDNIVGPGEMGHIISEKNGGKVSFENLIIQCKKCNTENGSNNLPLDRYINNMPMLAYLKDNDIMEFQNERCAFKKNNKEQCKNKPLPNSTVCGCHFEYRYCY